MEKRTRVHIDDSEAVATPVLRFGDILRRISGMGWTAGTALYALTYYNFEHLVWQQFGLAICRRQFDLVHRVTTLSPTTPSRLAGMCRRAGVPFLVGSLNRGVPWPPGFAHLKRQVGEWLAGVRSAYKLLPGARATRAEAAAILVGSRTTWGEFAGHHSRGLVPLVLDYAGPSEFVTDGNGFRVSIGLRSAVVDGFREVLHRIAANPHCLDDLRERARARVHALFTWKAKARQVLDLYRWVLGLRTKPDFGTPLSDPSRSVNTEGSDG